MPLAVALLALFVPVTETRIGLQAAKVGYQDVVAEVMTAFDHKAEVVLRSRYLAQEDRAVYSFGVALIDFYSFRLFWKKAVDTRPSDEGEMRIRIKRVMMHDPDAAYPVALYAWFVSEFREYGLAPEIREYLGTSKGTLSNGKAVEGPVYKIIDDPAKRARVQELNEHAIKLDKDNPMAKYGLAAGIKDPIESAKQLWSTLGEPGQYIWETDALARIKLRAKDDPDIQARVAKRIEQLKAKIGADSPRLKAYNF